MGDEEGGPPADQKKSQYAARLSRARSYNQERRSTSKSLLSGTEKSADGALWGSLTIDNGSLRSPDSSNVSSGMGSPMPGSPGVAGGSAGATSAAAVRTAMPLPPIRDESREPIVQPTMDAPPSAVLFEASDAAVGALWSWSVPRRMLAVVDSTQMLKLLDEEGNVLYRVKLPGEGTTIFVGWEASGAVLAAVQKLGGAFLWFPSKPGTVQQWEGMQFSSKMLKNSVLKRNAHFDTCFACWSQSGKLVLGLADGNFAVWDLASNETFMSRKHFAGKHHNAITCGAWAPQGEHLALASANQLKVSQPLLNASWEQTAAKLFLEAEANFQQLHFSRSGTVLAALAGSSIFRHLCLYVVIPDGKKGSKLLPVGEVHPGPQVGSLQALLWLEHDILAVFFSSGTLRFVKFDPHESCMVEHNYRTIQGGVIDAALLDSGHVAIVAQGRMMLWDPIAHASAGVVALPELPHGVRFLKVQAASDFVILARSDGALMKVPHPLGLPQLDLALVALSGGANDISLDDDGPPRTLAYTPQRLFRVGALEGASNSAAMPLHFCWSSQANMLALLNAEAELHVLKYSCESGGVSSVLQEKASALGRVAYLEWDPATEHHLALVMRGAGVGLWQVGSTKGVSMWTGMQFKNSAWVFSAASKEFDPIFARWSRAGQLAIGMADGSFAVWDSVTTAVSISQRSGVHKSGITAGDWLASLFAPALALASSSAIKVSQGFDGVEWPATALKVNMREEPASSGKSMLRSPLRRGGASKGGDAVVEVLELRFSSSGKYMAVLSAATNASHERQLLLYELREQRESLLVCREHSDFDGGLPFGFHWLADETLLLFTRNSPATCIRRLHPTSTSADAVWPPRGRSPPGGLVDASATSTLGLCAAVFSCGGAGEGAANVALLLSTPRLEQLALVRLDDIPQAVKLYEHSQDSCSMMVVSFFRGGVEVWRM